MGNRAVIVPVQDTAIVDGQRVLKPEAVGIYMHWNGGRDSVTAFLEYCHACGFRDFNSDRSYAFARFAQIVSNFFVGGLSIGIDLACRLDCDNWDNGVYVVNGWEIVDRIYQRDVEQLDYELKDSMLCIAEYQPEKLRLTEPEINEYLLTGEIKERTRL